MKILLTRHGQTKQNVDGIILKNDSTNITSKGYEDIAKSIEKLKKENLDLIISSDLPRCKLTAQEITKKIKVPVEYTELIREKEMGDFVGMKGEDIKWDLLEGNFEERRAPGGENLNEVKERAKIFFDNLLNRKDLVNKKILVISHGAFLKVFIGSLLGMNLYDSIFKLFIEHSSLTEIDVNEEYKAGYQIKGINRI